MSDYEEVDEDKPKQKHAPKGPTYLFKPILCYGNLLTTNVREDNIRDLASTGTQLLTQAPVSVILANIEE